MPFITAMSPDETPGHEMPHPQGHPDTTIDPDFGEAHMWLGSALLQQGRRELRLGYGLRIEQQSAQHGPLDLMLDLRGKQFQGLGAHRAWSEGFARNPANVRYEQMARDIDKAIKFMEAAGADFEELKRVEFYTSHEGLLMDYERPMTRIDSRNGTPVNTSAHFLWIGERTRQLDGAHVEYFSHIENPIGCKLGPSATADDALALAAKLNPTNEPGRLTFITRFGAGKIRDGLPPLVEKVTAEGVDVAWVCDAMHGNTFEASSGYKTRRFEDVLDEVKGFFEVHRALDTTPAGILVENTGDDVTEIIGGGEELDEQGLAHRYESVVDPRLNRVQSLEMAFQVAEMLRAK